MKRVMEEEAARREVKEEVESAVNKNIEYYEGLPKSLVYVTKLIFLIYGRYNYKLTQ